MTTFRIVWVITDPIIGTRFPIGALLERPDYGFLAARSIPSNSYVGSAISQLIELVIDTLISNASALERCGPLVGIGREWTVPKGYDPESWILDIILPNPPLDKYA